MDWPAVAKLLLFVAIIVGILPAVRQQWRQDRPGFIKTLKLMAAFALYCIAGIALMIVLAPAPSAPAEPDAVAVLAMTAFVVAWIFLGALWLARTVPRYKAVPHWIDHRFGPVELTLWGVIAASLLTRLLA
jgi:disulfide bond formation protein DsbB